MEVKDESGRAHLRMHGHTFFVPRTASGHLARVQATVVGGVGADSAGEDCKEGRAAAERAMAEVELDATGVELD
jgi:hypothetical protein